MPARDLSGATLRLCGSLDEVPAEAWDALHDGSDPFVCHAFLAGLERHGCLRARWGWTPRHVTLWRDDVLVAAAPGYAKANSHGEFVFDHAWAHAYAAHGRDYFPKWLCAVPYSPVSGPRLLAAAEDRALLLEAIERMVVADGFSSAHVNFHRGSEGAVFAERGVAEGRQWLARVDVQYHWQNASGWKDFDGFLAAMDHKHRKNIRQERARVAREGIEYRVVHGGEAMAADLAAMHGFYLSTFSDYGNSPALTLEFLQHLAAAMPRNLVLILAQRGGVPIAGALCLRGGDTLHGRYWGASETLPGLHFETCYYQGIAYCLREGLSRFEPGAQGEHKIARGFLPTLVHSHHWLVDPGFTAAIAPWCAQETEFVRRHQQLLALRTPFRDPRVPVS